MVRTPDQLSADYIASRWPRLYHMAEKGSWPSIQRHGLLSATALLDLFGIEGERRVAIEARKRRESVEIRHDDFGVAWIRDNKPINETVLRRTLTGMSEEEWYRHLNARVFFWLTERRLDKLRNAPPYRGREHDILVVDTASLLRAHAPHVELGPLNSGAVHPAASYPRGNDTFHTIERYPWRERRTTAEPIVELTLPYAVRDISEHVIDVQTR